MGWEQRGNRSYYYRKEREGSRVRSMYVGQRVLADLYEVMRKGRQAQRSVRRDKLQREKAVLESLHADLEALRRLTGENNLSYLGARKGWQVMTITQMQMQERSTSDLEKSVHRFESR